GLVEDAELGGQLAPGVRQHREREVPEIRMVLPPREVDEVRVGARAEDLGVALMELAVLLSELGDLGGADEGEVHGPEEDDLPLAREVLVGDVLELLALLEAHRGLEVECGKLVSDRQHCPSRSFVVWLDGMARGAQDGPTSMGLMRRVTPKRKQIIYL